MSRDVRRGTLSAPPNRGRLSWEGSGQENPEPTAFRDNFAPQNGSFTTSVSGWMRSSRWVVVMYPISNGRILAQPDNIEILQVHFSLGTKISVISLFPAHGQRPTARGNTTTGIGQPVGWVYRKTGNGHGSGLLRLIRKLLSALISTDWIGSIWNATESGMATSHRKLPPCLARGRVNAMTPTQTIRSSCESILNDINPCPAHLPGPHRNAMGVSCPRGSPAKNSLAAAQIRSIQKTHRNH